MTLEEPHAIGDSPEDRARAAKRKQNIRRVAVVVAVLIVVAVVIALLPTAPSKTVYVDPLQSSCKSGANNTMACTIVLDARQGSTVTVADIKSVDINNTSTSPTITASGASVKIVASIPAPFKDQNGASIPDVGATASPMANGDIVVYLTDGTDVTASLGPAGVLP